MRLDLNNTLELCEVLGNPQLKFKSVHIAGTNGKGSTSHMLASILQTAGYKTGLYTSPHLKSFTERIKINGEEIPEDQVIQFVNRVLPSIEKLKPSFFEITVAMAFDYFAVQKVDMAVIEVGLGGRLDSTNVILPDLSIITNIGWDHMDILGDSLEKIASEKAGIIKPGIPVVVSERQPEVEDVFLKKALTMNAALYFAVDQFNVISHFENGQLRMDVREGDNLLFQGLVLSLQGVYQKKNIVGIMQAVKLLNEKGFRISTQDIRFGLENVVVQTGLKGRWQILDTSPLIVCDTAHNRDGINLVLQQIREQSYQHLFFVFGMVKGKEIMPVLELLPKEAYYFFCQANIPRALEASLLFEQASHLQLKGEIVADVNDAIQHAKNKATPMDMIFIGGSTYVVAEINNL